MGPQIRHSSSRPSCHCRATPTDPFWEYIGPENWDRAFGLLAARDEPRALELAAELKARYVIVAGRSKPGRVADRLFADDGRRRGSLPRLNRFAAVWCGLGVVWCGLVSLERYGAVWNGLVWSGAAWSCLELPGVVWSGLAWSGRSLEWSGVVWCGLPRVPQRRALVGTRGAAWTVSRRAAMLSERLFDASADWRLTA